MLDVSEVSAIEQFNEISQQIKRFYPKGMHFYIFLEDFEGKYIEGDAVDIVESMQLYIRSFKTLITILGLDDVFSMIATSSIPRDDEELLRWKNLLSQNFRLLRDYWMESEEKGLQGAEKYTSFKALRENGFYSLINREIRDYYISRLDKIFGSSISNDSKLEMILKDFAVALLHKQTKMFSRPNIWDQRINVSMVPVIPGTPNQLIMGRINLRPMSRKDSKLSMPPWTGKGFLRMKDDVDRPAMRSFRDFHAGTNSIVKGSIVLRRGDLRVEISADHLLEDAVV